MISNHWLSIILLGGVMGALGQGVRAGLGFKKLQDEVGEDGTAFSAKFSASRFYTSIFLGFVVGALTALYLAAEKVIPDTSDKQPIFAADKSTLIALMVAGYSGVDAIEGLANKFIPSKQTRGTTTAL